MSGRFVKKKIDELLSLRTVHDEYDVVRILMEHLEVKGSQKKYINGVLKLSASFNETESMEYMEVHRKVVAVFTVTVSLIKPLLNFSKTFT